MPALSINVPFPVFQDRDGQPLDNGYVYIGTPYLDPQTNPVQVYFDDALTIPAAQPLRTINGYVSNAGTPAQLYVNGVNFSIKVLDSKANLVYSFPDGSGISPNASGVQYDPAGVGAVSTTVQAKLRETVSVKDFGAVGDGVADDTAAIQAAIAASSSVYLHFPPGTYLVSGVNVSNKTAFCVTGENAILKLKATFATGNSVAPVIQVSNTTTVYINGLEINGNKANQKDLDEANRANGAGILTNQCLYVTITNNYIHDNTAGAAILCAQGGKTGSPGVVSSKRTYIADNILENCGKRPIGPSVAATDGIYCQQDNSVIVRNKIFDFTDVGIAHDFGANYVIADNFIDGNAVGVQGVAAYGASYVNLVNNIIQTVGRGITYVDQGNSSWTNTRLNIEGNDLRGIKAVDVVGGDDNGINIIQNAGATYAKVTNNSINGGDYSIVVNATLVHIEGNDCFSPNIRGMNLSGQFLTIKNNKTAAPSPSYITNALVSDIDVIEVGNVQKRTFTGSVTFPSYWRACYVKTDDTSGKKGAVVNVYAQALLSAANSAVVKTSWRVTSNAGTLTITDMHTAQGNTSEFDVAIGQNGTSRAEILLRPNSSIGGSATMQIYIEVISLESLNSFYIAEV